MNIKIVVMTNNCLGMVRELQANGYNGRETAVYLDGSPDFIKLAEAYGIQALRVTDEASMNEAIKLLSETDQLCLVEVRVDEKAATL